MPAFKPGDLVVGSSTYLIGGRNAGVPLYETAVSAPGSIGMNGDRKRSSILLRGEVGIVIVVNADRYSNHLSTWLFPDDIQILCMQGLGWNDKSYFEKVGTGE